MILTPDAIRHIWEDPSDPTKFTFGFNDCVGNPDSYRDAKTNLRQMGQNKLAPDGERTYLRQMGKNKLAPDEGTKHTCAIGGRLNLLIIPLRL